MKFFPYIYLIAGILLSIPGMTHPVEVSRDTSAVTKRNFGFYFSLDTRNSIVKDVPIRITGLKIGVRIKQRHSVGFGYYNVGMPVLGIIPARPVHYDTEQSIISRRSGQQITVPAQISLAVQYLSLFYEYRILAHRKWNIDLTAQYGIGRAEIDAFNRINGFHLNSFPRKERIHLVEASSMFQYKIFTWFGVGAGVGYRYMLNPNDYVSKTFNYPIWVLKLMLFPGKLIPVFKGKEKWYK